MSYPNDRPRGHNPNDPPQNPNAGHPNYYPEQAHHHEHETEAQRLHREEARVAKAQRVSLAGKFIQALVYLVGALELLLGLRFLLRLTAANPDNTFANFIYGFSRPFVQPFSTLFISPTFNGSANIFDVNVLVAMSAYLVLLALAIWLIRIFTSR